MLNANHQIFFNPDEVHSMSILLEAKINNNFPFFGSSDVPGKPTGPIKFSQILADSVTLAWSPPKKDGGSVVTSYTVEQSGDNGRSWQQTGTVEASTTILTAKDLKEEKKYKFRVCAHNEVGASQPLESDNVTPQRQLSEYFCQNLLSSLILASREN